MNPFKRYEKILKIYISDKSLSELLRRWTDPSRHYHSVTHLNNILKEIESDPWFSELHILEKHILLLSAFFHDAVYDPKRKDNEDKSKEFFKKALYKTKNPTFTSEFVCRIIESTKYRKRPIAKLDRIFWDADNAMFKQSYSQLLKNEKLIHQEYSYLSKQKYKEGRTKFLESNLGLFGNYADRNIKQLINYIQKL